MQNVALENNLSYKINSMISGCCGCRALYYNVYQDKLLIEQFVVETDCELYVPTKHFFKYNTRHEVINYQSYVAVTDTSYQILATQTDKEAFSKLDSIYNTWKRSGSRKITFGEITGFKNGPKTHFPFNIKQPKNSKK